MAITQETERLKVLNEWRPEPKQSLFLSIPTTVKEAFYGGGAGSGKDISLDTIIPTSVGYKRMEDVHPGNWVYNHEGEQVIVVAESEIFTDHECYKIRFDSGQEIVCGSDHNWIVHKNQLSRNKIGRYQILTTQELFDSNDKWSVIISEPLQNLNEDYPIDPYTLGVWLGDGGAYDSKITCADVQIINRVCEKNEVTEYGYNYSFNIVMLASKLRDLNLLQNKHIPDLYFNLSFNCRLALLQGLMDTDGTITPSGTGIELSLSHERLAKDSLKLIRSLGIKASCNINKSILNGKNYKDRYRIKFATKIPVFSLKRKVERHEIVTGKSNNNTSRNKWHYIESIEKTETVPTKCIQVLGGIYVCGEGCIPTHNSDVLLLYGIVHRWYAHSQFKQVFMRRTYPELRNEIIPRSRELYRKFGATLNKTEMCWTFPREDQYGGRGGTNEGAMIFLGHCENEDDVHQYDTMQICLYTPDELTSITEWIYTYITFQRNRAPTGTGLPSITRAAGMPGGIGHTWTYKRFIKPYPKGGVIINGRGGNKRIYIHATLEDNKYIDPSYKQSLSGITIDAERKAKLYGDWDAYQGQVFDEFRDRKFDDEPETALHVIPEFEIPAWWPRIVVGDWGFRAMTWIGYGAISPTKRLYIYREQYWVKTKISEWAPHVKLWIDKESPRLIRFCKSAGQDRGQEHTIQQQIETELGESIELSNNTSGSRVAGKILIHEYLRWTPKVVNETDAIPYNEEYALWLMRNRGMKEYNSYLGSFESQTPESNLPKLQIFAGACPILIDAIKACSYDKPKGNKPAEDIAEFDGDDPIDGLRYMVDAAEGFFDEANEEFKRVQKQEELVNQLNNSGDWTGFYRNMNRVESESDETVRPVGRYRH